MHTPDEQRRLYTISGDLASLTKEMDRFGVQNPRLRPFKYRRNPLPALALAAISGLGIGAGATAGGILVNELAHREKLIDNPAIPYQEFVHKGGITEMSKGGVIINPSKQRQTNLMWAIGALVVLFFSKDMLPK